MRRRVPARATVRTVSEVGVRSGPLGGFTTRARPAFGIRPSLRFTLAVASTIAWAAFSVWV